MGARFRTVRWLIAGLLWAGTAGAVPSKYVKQQAVKAADQLLPNAQAQLARFEKMKADGKLDKMLDGDVPIGLDIARKLRAIYDDALDAYFEAVVTEGWPETDPDIAKIRETLEAARAKLETCGMWSCVRFGESPIKEYKNRLEVMRDEAAIAATLYRLKEVDKANETLEWLDKRLAGLKAELEKAEEEGRETALTLTHPAYLRTLEAITKERGSGAAIAGETAGARKLIDDEVAALTAMLAECDGVFRLADGLAGSSGTEEQRFAAFKAGAEKLAEFDRTQRPKVEQMMKEFGSKYGTEEQAIDNKIRELKGGQLDYNRWPGVIYRDLTNGLAAVAKARGDSAERLYGDVSHVLDGIADYSEFIRLETIDKQRPVLEMLLQLDPEHAQGKERLAGLDAFRAKAAQDIEKAIDARNWPAPMKSFSGPGKVDQLAASALAFLRNEGHKDRDVLAVVVIEDWEVFDRDALGRPLTYGLPVLVAYKMHKDEGKDLAEVFELAMLTQQTKMAPPWKASATAGHYWFRASKIKPMK